MIYHYEFWFYLKGHKEIYIRRFKSSKNVLSVVNVKANHAKYDEIRKQLAFELCCVKDHTEITIVDVVRVKEEEIFE